MTVDAGNASLNVCQDAELREYVDDLLTYGLTRYQAEHGEVTGFLLWQSWRMDQVFPEYLQYDFGL